MSPPPEATRRSPVLGPALSLIALPVRAMLACGCLGFGAWLLCWHLWLGALYWLALAALLARPPRWWAWLPALPIGLLLVPWCVYGYTLRVTALTAKLDAGGPSALNLADRVAVWGLNLLMAATGALLGFPEVAAETALLAVPRGEQLTWRTDHFPRCAPTLAAIVAEQQAQARAGRTSFEPQRISWRYGDQATSARAALALNPVTLRSHASHGLLVLEFTVPVDYPPRYALVFARVGGVEIAVEEGLFHALEELGWLSPYELTYRSFVDFDTPAPPPCEAWSVRVARAAGISPF